MDKKDKPIAVITGGSSGLGLAIAKQLAESGYELILIARNKEKLQLITEEFQKKSISVSGFDADITDEVALNVVTKFLEKNQKKINFLVLNAGVAHTSAVKDDDIIKMKNEININLWGTILSTKIFLPLMADHSRMLFISSALALVGSAGDACYCASKAGINNFAAALRRELLNKTAVYIACPADIDTPMYQEELNTLPEWMELPSVRGKAMTADTAAYKILKKCRGNRLIITINTQVYFFLLFLPRFLPATWLNWLADNLLSRPK